MKGLYPIDISGIKFQMLTALKLSGVVKGRQKWLCKCECGNEKVISRGDLTAKNTKSCGCARRLSKLNQQFFSKYIGIKFGRWTVVSFEKSKPAYQRFKLICECGGEGYAPLFALKSGQTKSCGCLKSEVTSKRLTVHGASKGGKTTASLNTWNSIKNRCRNQNLDDYKNYGGRGIKICERWAVSFLDFLSDLGERPKGMTIERIDNNGNYSCGKCSECIKNNWPMNAKWADRMEQANNKRNNNFLVFNGERKTVSQWARKVGIDPDTLWMRIKRGWGVEESILTPLRTI